MIMHITEDVVVNVAEEVDVGFHAPVVPEILQGGMFVEEAAVSSDTFGDMNPYERTAPSDLVKDRLRTPASGLWLIQFGICQCSFGIV